MQAWILLSSFGSAVLLVVIGGVVGRLPGHLAASGLLHVLRWCAVLLALVFYLAAQLNGAVPARCRLWRILDHWVLRLDRR